MSLMWMDVIYVTFFVILCDIFVAMKCKDFSECLVDGTYLI